MSNKIRLIFVIAIFIIFIASIVVFNGFKSPLNHEIEKISEFKITKISGNGKIYFDNAPIPTQGSEYSSAQPVETKQMQFSGPLYFRSDDQTAFEFYCFGTFFTALPGSYIYHQSQTGEFYFYSGEIYWDKVVKGKKDTIPVFIREVPNTLNLAGSGRVRIGEDSVYAWNYSKSKTDNLTFSTGTENFNITPGQVFIFKPPSPPEIFNVLPLTESIDPEKTAITLNNPEDSVVRFNWKNVPGAKQYVFRLYSSNLKENILVEKSTPLTWLNLDLLQFENREFYWQVFPVDIDAREQLEGVPSKLGYIQVNGYLLSKKDVQKPPQLLIKDLTVNGNIVIVKGNADTSAQLYINDELVNLDMDGEFIHYLTFKTIGPKRIFFRLVSPLGVETTEERYVTIFAE